MRRELTDGYEIDDDHTRIDRDVVAQFLYDESYWAAGRPRDVIDRSFDGSARLIGLYSPDGNQVGFARVVSDTAVFAYLADVFVLPGHRDRGFGVELVREAVESEGWSGLLWSLSTHDGQGLYEKVGFDVVDGRWMVRRRGR